LLDPLLIPIGIKTLGASPFGLRRQGGESNRQLLLDENLRRGIMANNSCENKTLTDSMIKRENDMKTATITGIIIVLGFYALVSGDEPPPVPAQEEPEVLTRGPVNEAFAEPVNLTHEDGVVVNSEPPASIVENVPSERPVGDQFVWVPGYWAWDSDRNGYIWVSGCWRAAPPRMYWVPGYWAKIPQGWQWVAGFWTPAGNDEIEYLPAPPAIDDTPPGPAPYPDRLWVPPCWYWSQGQYIRRSGYWLAAQADWVWVPSHYIRTPRGYVFAGGHWDYSLTRRGVLFAPVYFPRHVYERPRFSYTLSVVVDIGNLEFGLFTYPRYSHYYFGDYYDNAYISIGIFPWFECERRHTWYDPIYVHDRWRHQRNEPRWEEHEREEYEHRRNDRDLRPPRTYREMERRVALLPEAKRRDIQIARPINVAIHDKTTSFKFEYVKTDERLRISSKSDEVHKFRDDRSRWESERGGKETVKPVPVREQRATEAPSTERKEQVTTPMERKGPEARPSERVTLPTERKGPEMRPSEHKEPAAPAPSSGIEQRQSDRVKVPTPPITSRKGVGIFRKGPPSRPSDERKTEVKDTRVEKDTTKGSDARVEKDKQKSSEAGRESEKDSRKDRGERGKNN
jgi:hypothetical protein